MRVRERKDQSWRQTLEDASEIQGHGLERTLHPVLPEHRDRCSTDVDYRIAPRSTLSIAGTPTPYNLASAAIAIPSWK